jgi:hypothetical protein
MEKSIPMVFIVCRHFNVLLCIENINAHQESCFADPESIEQE